MNFFTQRIKYLLVIALLACLWTLNRPGSAIIKGDKGTKLKTVVTPNPMLAPLSVSIAKNTDKGTGISLTRVNPEEAQKADYAAFINNHPFNQKKSEKEEEEGGEFDNETLAPTLAWEQDFLRTMDPQLKRPTPEVLAAIVKQNNSNRSNGALIPGIPGAATTPWVERGPNNVGGRTRILVWDPNDVNGKKVWAGGVSGGLWYNNDITDANASWTKVDDFWPNLSAVAMAFDPNNSQIAYVGTGEGFSVTTPGAGIWKTTNGGTTWTQLTSTANFSFVSDLAVRNEGGTSVIYAAIDGLSYKGIFHNAENAGLQRSTDGGATWTQVLPNIPGNQNGVILNFNPASISISKTNRIWVGTRQSPFGADNQGGGYILYSDDGTTWVTSNVSTVTNGSGRITVACAPSDGNFVYAFVEDNNKLKNILKTVNAGTNWAATASPVDADNGIPANDFTRGQAFYDQAIKVDPNDPNVVIVGGIDLFRTTNGGTSWTQISKWSDNGPLANLTSSTVHADHHAIAFKPGSSSTVLFGNDGGVFYTTSIATAGTVDVIKVRNMNYNVTQFYSAAQHPTGGSNYFLGGTQDNGTQKFNGAGISATTEATGGDGAYCFIDQTNPLYQITSYTNNQYYLSTDGGATFPTAALNDGNTGSFINPATYDNSLHILYTYKDRANNSIYRMSGVTGPSPTVSTVTIAGLTSAATAFSVSPYTTASTTLYIGTNNGKILKATNADATPTVTDLSAGLPTGSVSCIEIGASENELLVTFFNYGIAKIWYSSNGGTSWVDKSGNYPNIPARWALFNPNNRNEVILATELGIYGTTGFNSATPAWTQSNNGFANVRTDMLQIRKSDFQVIAGTHGRGMYSSSAFNTVQPAISSFTPTSAGAGATITITGTNLTGVTAVSFGGTAALTFTNVSATTVTAVVGQGATGTLSLTTAGGTATFAGFTFIPAPTVSSFTPTSAGSGAVITITGTNFSGVPTVTFGGTAASSVSLVSATTITAVVGAGSSGSLSVTTLGGTAGLAGFTFIPAPAISSFTPTGAGAGATVTITGTNLSGTTTVTFGGTNATSFTNVSATTVTAVVGSGTSGNVSITTPGGTASRSGFAFCLPPTLTAGGATTFCSGGSVTLTTNGQAPLQWLKDGTPVSGATNASFSATTTGVYTVSATVTGGCTLVSAGTSVTVNALPATPTISASGPVSFCTGGSVTLTSSASTGNQWIKDGTAIASANNATLAVNTPNTYSVSVTNTNNCAATSTGTAVVINPLPAVPTVSAGGPLTFCDTGKVVLTSSAATGNQWFNGNTAISSGGTGVTYTANVSGTYKVVVTDINSCSASSAGTVVTANTTPPKPTITASGADLLSSSSAGNLWYKDASAITPAVTTQTYRPTLSGYYKVQASIAGCTGAFSDAYYYLVTAVVNISGNTIGSYKILPNPVTDKLSVQATSSTNKISIKLFSPTGSVVISQEFIGSILINMSALSPGMYTVILTDTKTRKQESKQIIKQ